jgi:hypothetical protein
LKHHHYAQTPSPGGISSHQLRSALSLTPWFKSDNLPTDILSAR